MSDPGVLATVVPQHRSSCIHLQTALISPLNLPSHREPACGVHFIMYLDAPFQISCQLNNSTTSGTHFCAGVAECAASPQCAVATLAVLFFLLVFILSFSLCIYHSDFNIS